MRSYSSCRGHLVAYDDKTRETHMLDDSGALLWELEQLEQPPRASGGSFDARDGGREHEDGVEDRGHFCGDHSGLSLPE